MKRQRKDGARAFTLIELIVVIGLMGLLATVSVGGYFAAARGMAARGVVQDTASLIRQAMQTCLIDQVPTAVLFLNRRTNTRAEGGEAYGTAIAIKMAGRISYVAKNGGKTSQGKSISGDGGGGALLIDEFADWNQSYSVDASDKSEQRSVRLYRMFSGQDGVDSLGKGLKSCSSLMCAWVGCKEFDQDYMIAAGSKVDDWCAANKKEWKDVQTFSGIGYRNANNYRWGLPFHPRNNGLGPNDWRIGDAYGVEIAQLDLPRNYIFGTSVPPDAELTPASSPSKGVLVFTPGMVRASNEYRFRSGVRVDISLLNDVEGTDKAVIGTINDSLLEDQD